MTAAGPQGFAGYFAPKRHAQAIPPGSKKRHQGVVKARNKKEMIYLNSLPLATLRTRLCFPCGQWRAIC